MMRFVLLLMAACGGLLPVSASEEGGMKPPPPVFPETAGRPAAHGSPDGFGVPRGARSPRGNREARPPRFVPPTRQQIALRMMVRQLLLQQYDLDQDQHLNEEERSALLRDAREAMQKQAADIARRFDQDGDGRLNAGERARMRESLPCPPPQPGDAFSPRMAPSPHPQGKPTPKCRAPRRHAMDRPSRAVAFMAQRLIMATYDANHNGQLDADERARFAEDGKKLYDSREAALLAQYDTDGDGRLSEAELKAALQVLLPPRPERSHDRPGRGCPPAERPHAQQDEPCSPAEGAPREGKKRSQGFGRNQNRRHHEHSPRRHGNPPPHRHALERMLDPHFDVDILLHLAHPEPNGAAHEPSPPTPDVSPQA